MSNIVPQNKKNMSTSLSSTNTIHLIIVYSFFKLSYIVQEGYYPQEQRQFCSSVHNFEFPTSHLKELDRDSYNATERRRLDSETDRWQRMYDQC
jgi:hypothetical protein